MRRVQSDTAPPPPAFEDAEGRAVVVVLAERLYLVQAHSECHWRWMHSYEVPDSVEEFEAMWDDEDD